MATCTIMKQKSYKFVSEPDDALNCLVCLEVAEDPWQHSECGRLLCKKCLFKYGRKKPCPACMMELPQYFPDNKSKREIKALRVVCNNGGEKCQWKGTYAAVHEHLNTCQYELLPCPKKCKDAKSKVKQFVRKEIEKHLAEDCPHREHTCPHCGEKDTYANITFAHDSTCKMKTILCINEGCPCTMQRQHLDVHCDYACEHAVVTCKHRSIGCEVELKRKDMPAHEQDDTLHLHMAINTITEMKKKDESVIIKYKDFEARRLNKTNVTSQPFHTKEGYSLALSIDANGSQSGRGSHVSVYAPIVKGPHDHQLRWPLVGKITFTLLNQAEDKNHLSATLVLESEDNAKTGKSWGFPKFIPHYELGYDPAKNTHYLKDDTMYFRVALEVEGHKPWLEYASSV